MASNTNASVIWPSLVAFKAYLTSKRGPCWVTKLTVVLNHLGIKEFKHTRKYTVIKRSLFNDDHLAFKDAFAKFTAKEIAPFHAQWEEQGFVDRDLWRKAGANGYLCMSMPEAFGGSDADKLYSVVQFEVLSEGGLYRRGLWFAQRDCGALLAALRHT